METFRGFEVHRAPGNGNCLFLSLAMQLYGYSPSSASCQRYARNLRHEVVTFLTSQVFDPVYRMSLLSSAIDVFGLVFGEEDMISSYLRHLSQDGSWSGEETLLSIAHLYSVRIEVFQEDVPTIPFGVSDWVVRLLYRGGNHYDSLVPFPPVFHSYTETTLPHVEPTIPPASIFPTPVLPISNSSVSPLPARPFISDGGIRIGTMNVQGCAPLYKRNRLDILFAETHHLDLVVLQETNLCASETYTRHYRWFFSGQKATVEVFQPQCVGVSSSHSHSDVGSIPPLSGVQSSSSLVLKPEIRRKNSVRNGVALLIRLASGCQVTKFRAISERLCYGIVCWGSHRLVIICVHVPTGRSSSSAQTLYTRLSTILNQLSRFDEIVLLGDFNGHLGRDLLDFSRPGLIGANIFHEATNERGQLLYDFVHQYSFRIATSFRGRSVLTTWRNSFTTSQLDHVLIRFGSPIRLRNLIGRYTGYSDHKLITCFLTNLPVSSLLPSPEASLDTHSIEYGRCSREWNMDLLKEEVVLNNYQDIVHKTVSAISSSTPVSLWRSLVSSMRFSARECLSRPSPFTPRRRRALARMRQAIFREKRGFISKAQVQRARLSYQVECKRARLRACTDFFFSLDDYSAQQRLIRTHRFLREFQRKRTASSRLYLPLLSWEEQLERTSGSFLDLIPELDYFPLGAPPTLDEVKELCTSLRTGSAPGLDQISVPLLTSLPASGFDMLTDILGQVWLLNEPPPEWLETIQFPLKKIPRPKTISDFRRITLTDIGYRVYSKFLLLRLGDYIKPFGTYQAAFQRNRSTDDHMFVVRRIMEEEWRFGRTLYVLSLDLKRAFDCIRLDSVVSVLTLSGVPHYLINRLIKTCLWERTSVMWCGLRTKVFPKVVGMKQGCPVSPTLFNLVFDYVLTTLSTSFPSLHLNLNQCDNLTLPLLLAYADDIIILHTDISQLSLIVSHLIPLLRSVGLVINESKSELLIRSPCSIVPDSSHHLIGGMNIPVKETIKYLGTYLTSKLSRVESVAVRCGKALGLSKVLANFVRLNQIPSHVVLRMYSSVIVPLLCYGLKTSVLTKANRLKLRRYEHRILSEMLMYSRFRPSTRSARVNLGGRTITRKISVYRILYWGHVTRRDRYHLLNAALRYNHPRKKTGRPCFTWKTSLYGDFRRYPLSKAQWISLSSDKKRLGSYAREIYDQDTISSDDMSQLSWPSDS